MLFRRFDGQLMMDLHSRITRERTRADFEIEDTGDTLRLKNEIIGKVEQSFRAPKLTRTRMFLALAITVSGDGCKSCCCLWLTLAQSAN